ncbi:ribosomal oxygenase 1-like isoform X1 [Clavelina lepadiformis]|uniref:ribosomal oxygenase 1-like isoform X1 n=1 Tax=Clavelina lepadiformis TaxID=159417 RepID=UPI00404232C8
MGKANKLSKTSLNKSKVPVPLSAFAIYSAQTTTTKRGRVESSSSVQEPKAVPTYLFNPENDRTSQVKNSTTSTSLIKQISNKAAFSLRRASTKRKKKQKKFTNGSQGADWQPYFTPNDDEIQTINFIKSGPIKFSSTASSVQFEAKLTDDIAKDEAGNKQTIYKEDRSIELSTSQSLTECEDEGSDDKTKKDDVTIHRDGVTMDLVVMEEKNNLQPPKKKVRVASRELLDQERRTLKQEEVGKTQEQLHGDVFKSTEKTSTSFTTISKKASSIPKMPFPQGNSEKDGRLLFEWLIQPFGLKKFFSNIWERKPLLVRRHISNYAEGLFSSDDLNTILNECNVRFGVNLDVTTYQDGRRETHNVEGRAFAPVVWDYYKNGCSVRLKNPQAFSKPVWQLCATLQEYFKSMVGSNIYLTPPGTQGFAPHYDDIEAFVLQLEGKKRWSLYNPRSAAETLPRFSSKNFDPSEIGEEIFSTTLEPGDLLYFPRGFIHQASSLPGSHSLHITISTYQRNSWGDLMQELFSCALTRAFAEDLEFRKGLPLDYLSSLGVENSDKVSVSRSETLKKVSELFARLAQYADVDGAVDQRGMDFLYDALPPALSQDELDRTIHGAKVKMTSPGHPSACLCGVSLETKVRVLRKNAVRVCLGSDANENVAVTVHHSLQNSRVYHEEERKFFELEADCAPALEFLLHRYPAYVPVASLPLDSDEEKVNFASSLFEKGILIAEEKIELVPEQL